MISKDISRAMGDVPVPAPSVLARSKEALRKLAQATVRKHATRWPPGQASRSIEETLRMLDELEPHKIELAATNARDDDGAPVCRIVLTDNPELKKAEEMLCFHSDILNSLAEGVYLICVSSGEIVFTNSPLDLMFGYSSGELLGKHVSIVNAPGETSPEAVAGLIMAELERTGVWEGEVQNIKRDGTVFWSHAKVTTLNHQRYGQVWVSAHEDITGRKRLEQEREQYFKFFLRSVDAMCIADRNGNLVKLNPAFAKLTGYEDSELMGKSLLDLVLPAGCSQALDEFKRYLGSHEVRNLEGTYVRKDGSARLLSWNACHDKNNGFTYATARDVTELRHTEAEILKAGDRFRTLFDAISDPVLISNMDGLFVLVNPAACESLGYSQEEMLQMGPADINTPEAALKVPERVKEVVEKGKLIFESSHLHKNGLVIPVELSARAIDFEGKPACIVVARDITERKQAEHQLRNIAVTLEEQVIARTSLLRAVSAQLAMTEERERRTLAQDLHDNLSQLLAVIKIKLSSLNPAAFASSIEQIVGLVDQADRSARTITRELSPQILHTLGFIPALVSLAKEKKRMFGLTVNIECDAGPNVLEGGVRAMLYRSVSELLTNIGKHAKVSEAYLASKIDESHLLLIVCDRGCGFNPANYHDTTMEYQGFGLKSIYERVTNIGGDLVIVSSPGDGTTVILSVPYVVATREGQPS
ncbi:MAG: PAS domain S-box protein [Proteobacteria bacterium]|nr:PAS domain S-box protein [Pseudomonadota bacterium]